MKENNSSFLPNVKQINNEYILGFALKKNVQKI